MAKSNSRRPSGSSPLRSDGLHDGKAGRLGRCEACLKDTQNNAKSQEGLPDSSPLRSVDSCGSQAGKLDNVNCGQKRRSRESWKMTLGSKGTYLKTGIVTALNDDADDDDEVQTVSHGTTPRQH